MEGERGEREREGEKKGEERIERQKDRRKGKRGDNMTVIDIVRDIGLGII